MRKITLLNTTKDVGYKLLWVYGSVDNILKVEVSREVTDIPNLNEVLSKITVLWFESGVLIVGNEMDFFKISYYLCYIRRWKMVSGEYGYCVLSKNGENLIIKIKEEE